MDDTKHNTVEVTSHTHCSRVAILLHNTHQPGSNLHQSSVNPWIHIDNHSGGRASWWELDSPTVSAEMSREMYHGRLLGVTNSVALNR